MKHSKSKTRKSKLQFNITKVLMAVAAIVVLLLIAGIINSQNQRQSRDAQRKSDLNTIQAQLEAYRAQIGYYPSLAQLNDANFRANSLPQLQPVIVRDPSWTSANHSCSVADAAIFQLSTPSDGCYAYTPAPYGCNNQNGDNCASYTLTANLEASDAVYSKQSIY